MRFGENKGLNFVARSATPIEASEQRSETSKRSEARKATEGPAGSEQRSEGTRSSEGTEGLLTSAGSQIYEAGFKANKANKELSVVFAVLTLAGAVGAWLW